MYDDVAGGNIHPAPQSPNTHTKLIPLPSTWHAENLEFLFTSTVVTIIAYSVILFIHCRTSPMIVRVRLRINNAVGWGDIL